MEDKTYQYYTNSCKSYLAIKKQQKKWREMHENRLVSESTE
jgi:hypothetical protein